MRHVTSLYFNFLNKIFIKCFKNSILLSAPNRFSVRPSYSYSLPTQYLQVLLKEIYLRGSVNLSGAA